MAGEDDSNSTFYLNLDASDFIAQANQAAGAIKSLGGSESLSGLLEGMEGALPVIGALGAAFFAVKASMDMVFDAEKIKLVNSEFTSLANSAGQYSEKLKAGLVEASHGWADETEVMNAANRAMIELETGADKLPELMDLARKATASFGGELTQNFTAMADSIASGNVRGLRQFGIIVDIQKAYRDYAASIGTTVSALSKAGQQQAMMNAALAQGKEKFSNVDENIRENINLWEQLKATVKEIGEVIALAFDNLAGHAMARFFTMMKNGLDSTKTWLQATFGEGAEQSAAKVKLLGDRISDIKQKLEDIKEHKGIAAAMTVGEAQIQTRQLTLELQKYEAELGKAAAANDKLADSQKKQESAAVAAAKANSSVDSQKDAQQRAKETKELAALNEQLTKAQIDDMDSVAEANKLYQQQLQQEGAKVQAQINEIRAQEAAGLIHKDAANKQIAVLNEIKDKKMEQDDQKLHQMQEQALDNYKTHAETVFQGVGRAFQEMSLKNKHAMQDFGAFGDKVANSFGTHMTNAFKEIGSGAKSASDAMEDAMLGMIAEVAENYGQMMMLASIWPPNPPVFAAGAALVMLGGLLGSLGSGTSSGALTAGSPDTGISGSPGSLNDPANPTGGTSLASQTNGPGQVNLIIQGHMFGTDQTQRWLVDQIRNAADSTDFKIQSVGGGL